jgi:hypothetical protein
MHMDNYTCGIICLYLIKLNLPLNSLPCNHFVTSHSFLQIKGNSLHNRHWNMLKSFNKKPYITLLSFFRSAASGCEPHIHPLLEGWSWLGWGRRGQGVELYGGSTESGSVYDGRWTSCQCSTFLLVRLVCGIVPEELKERKWEDSCETLRSWLKT